MARAPHLLKLRSCTARPINSCVSWLLSMPASPPLSLPSPSLSAAPLLPALQSTISLASLNIVTFGVMYSIGNLVSLSR